MLVGLISSVASKIASLVIRIFCLFVTVVAGGGKGRASRRRHAYMLLRRVVCSKFERRSDFGRIDNV